MCFRLFKSLIFLFSIVILQVKAETKIIAKNGDTLLKIAKQYGVPLKELMHKNKFNNAKRIIEGELIIIPLKNDENKNKENPLSHKIIEGDTLYKIARDYNVNLKDIIYINNLDIDSLLKPNTIILLPQGANYNKVINKKVIKVARKKVFYHQTSSSDNISDISEIHKVPKEKIISLNKLNYPIEINPNIKLKIRNNKTNKWLKYGSLIVNWSDWMYLDGNYITQVKNKENRYFYLAISCEKRILNHTLKNSYWTNWYFPESDFEFKLINDFCDKDFNF